MTRTLNDDLQEFRPKTGIVCLYNLASEWDSVGWCETVEQAANLRDDFIKDHGEIADLLIFCCIESNGHTFLFNPDV